MQALGEVPGLVRVYREALFEPWPDFFGAWGESDIEGRSVPVTENGLLAGSMDGRSISVPLTGWPCLAIASAVQRSHREIAGGGLIGRKSARAFSA